MNNKYLTRPNSNAIDTLMNDYDITKAEAARALGITVKEFKYKMVKNHFTMADFIKLLLYITDTCSIEYEMFEKCYQCYRAAKGAKRHN